MNKERILALANLIEKQPHVRGGFSKVYLAESGFSMMAVEHNCGTPSCIAGFARHMSINANEGDDEQDFLGLPNEAAKELFYPSKFDLWGEITPIHAAFTLRHLIETGRVDWTAYPASAALSTE